jgi:hypothetical protein
MKIRKEETMRLRSVIIKTGVVLCAGVAYALLVGMIGRGIPCVFRLVTGLQCPGCGITRMFLSLLKLDFAAAARYNLLVLCLLPLGVGLYFYKTWQYIKKGNTDMSSAEKLIYCICFVLCIVFCVLRNSGALPPIFQ